MGKSAGFVLPECSLVLNKWQQLVGPSCKQLLPVLSLVNASFNWRMKCVAVGVQRRRRMRCRNGRKASVAIKFKGGQNLGCYHCFSKASYEVTLPLISLQITHNTYQTNMRLLVQYQSLKYHSFRFTVKSKHKEHDHGMTYKTVPLIALTPLEISHKQ